MIKVTTSGWQDPEYDANGTEVRLASKAGLTGVLTDFVNEVHLWCFDAGIDAEFVAVEKDAGVNITTWYIPNEAHRMAFILRWQ